VRRGHRRDRLRVQRCLRQAGGLRVAPLRARHDAPPPARGSSTLCGSMVVMVSPLSTSERF
jgi:hypothetical protein